MVAPIARPRRIARSTAPRFITGNEPGSASLYFNQNGYTADGREMIYTTPEGISALDLATHAAKPVVKGKVRAWVSEYYRQPRARYEIETLLPRGFALVGSIRR